MLGDRWRLRVAMALGLGATLTTAGVSVAHACGMFRSRLVAPEQRPTLSREKVVLIYDEEKKTEHFIREIAFAKADKAFGFVVPVVAEDIDVALLERNLELTPHDRFVQLQQMLQMYFSRPESDESAFAGRRSSASDVARGRLRVRNRRRRPARAGCDRGRRRGRHGHATGEAPWNSRPPRGMMSRGEHGRGGSWETRDLFASTEQPVTPLGCEPSNRFRRGRRPATALLSRRCRARPRCPAG